MRVSGNQKIASSQAVRVAIYTRKSTDHGLEQEFNSLDAQRQDIEAYILSQRGKGWIALSDRYDDGGFSGGNTDRPAFQRLLHDIEAGKIDVVAVYKIDRLSRSLLDFAKIINFFEKHNVSFVSITQQFNTADSMGKLTLNILMSFAEFERQVISERTRDKMGATRRKGMWTGGRPPLGYDLENKKLIVNEEEAEHVRQIFQLYLEHGSLLDVATEVNKRGWITKFHTSRKNYRTGGRPFDKASVQRVLTSPIYLGQVEYEGERYQGEHTGIVDQKTWDLVQAQLEAHRWKKGQKARKRWDTLLTGLVRCGVCDAGMTHHFVSKKKKRYHYYLCESILKAGNSACPGSRIAMNKLEGYVVDQIRTIGQDPALLKETLAALQREQDERIPELQAEVRQIETDRNRLKAERRDLLQTMAREEPGTTGSMERLQELDDRLGKLAARLDEVQRDLDALKSHPGDEEELKTALQAFSPIWDQLFPREKARILHLLIETIVFNGQEQTVEIKFRPSGITALASELEEEEAA